MQNIKTFFGRFDFLSWARFLLMLFLVIGFPFFVASSNGWEVVIDSFIALWIVSYTAKDLYKEHWVDVEI